MEPLVLESNGASTTSIVDGILSLVSRVGQINRVKVEKLIGYNCLEKVID